jgi:hypothetical protein
VYKGIGEFVLMQVYVTGFESPEGLTIRVNRDGTNGLAPFNIKMDSNGQMTFGFYGRNLGDDILSAFYIDSGVTITSNTAIVTWGICTYGAKQCINSTSYQICRIGYDNEHFWDDAESCCFNSLCKQIDQIGQKQIFNVYHRLLPYRLPNQLRDQKVLPKQLQDQKVLPLHH